MEDFVASEPISNILTVRVGVISHILKYFGYAHQWAYLLDHLWTKSKYILSSNPFTTILNAVKRTIKIHAKEFTDSDILLKYTKRKYSEFINFRIEIQ